jgi:hypothetical protein
VPRVKLAVSRTASSGPWSTGAISGSKNRALALQLHLHLQRNLEINTSTRRAPAPSNKLNTLLSHVAITMDIDDILREVDPTFHSIPQEKRDLQELTRAWVAERSAPELLPYAS